MTRHTMLIGLLALGLAACGGSDDGGITPTSPTSPSSQTSDGGGGCARPAAPANFAAAVSGSNAALTWSAVSGARDYVIMAGTTPGASNALSTNTSQSSYNWNGIAPGTYYARVEARNTCGSGAQSNQLTFTIG